MKPLPHPPYPDFLLPVSGVALASTNLLIDGFTNAEQDRINRAYHPSPFYMMAMVNFWSVLLALAFLFCRYLYLGAHSEIAESLAFLAAHPSFRADLALFCVTNAVGQVEAVIHYH